MRRHFIWVLLVGLFFGTSATAQSRDIKPFIAWLDANADEETLLPHSHVGDPRFLNWTLTYDAAVTALAWTAVGQPEKAQTILDFYIQSEPVWRLGGLIEGVNAASAAIGEDWSVRTGSNIWMALASAHLFQVTKEERALTLSKKLAGFVLSLQDLDEKSPTFGGIRLGPAAGPNVVGDQHLNYDPNQPAFTEIFATEHNIDAYALFGLLFQITNEKKYQQAQKSVLGWLQRVGYNRQEHRFNRGFRKAPDTVVATDVQSWGISALGVDALDTFEPQAAEKIMAFIESRCVMEVEYQKPDGSRMTVRGVDFVDGPTVATLDRGAMISPEWTFQLINAYQRLESDFARRGDKARVITYAQKREELTQSILNLATPTKAGKGFPYATQAGALIGHEYRTPAAGTLSTIGTAYAVLALTGFDPLQPNTPHLKN